VATSTAEFADQRSCEQAGQTLKQKFSSIATKIEGLCIKKVQP
jgi:hypothetical protein